MADATAKVVHKTRPRAGRSAYVLADGITVFEGMFAQVESGFLNHWDETGSFLGIVLGGDDRAGTGILIGETSDTPPPEARVDESGVTLMHKPVASATVVGVLVYCADSNPANMTITDTTNPPVGYIQRFRSASDCDVTLFTPAEHRAGIADASWNA